MVQQVIGVFTALRICSLVPKPRKLVIVTDIVPRLCIGEHLHHDRPVRHDLLRRHQLSIANTDSERSHAECLSGSVLLYNLFWFPNRIHYIDGFYHTVRGGCVEHFVI